MHRSRGLAQKLVQSQSWSVLKSKVTCASSLQIQLTGQVRYKKTVSKNPSESVKSSANSSQNGVSHLFVPIPVKAPSEDTSVGVELAGKLNKQDVLQVLNRFFRRSEVKLLSAEHGLDSKFF